MTLPADVLDDEAVVSFIVESSKIIKDCEVDHRQFLPSKKYGNHSVYRTAGASEIETAAAGHAIALQRPKPGIHGWAAFVVKAIRSFPPLTLRSAEPPPRHALIEGWPQAPQDQRTLAIQLANQARFVKYSTIPRS
jgi:hypothetical protein